MLLQMSVYTSTQKRGLSTQKIKSCRHLKASRGKGYGVLSTRLHKKCPNFYKWSIREKVIIENPQIAHIRIGI